MAQKTFPTIDEDVSLPFAFTSTKKSKSLPTQLGFIHSLWHFATGKWMQSGDSTTDLRNQMITEQTSISLVAALFATISIPSMFACDGWEEDWKKGIYGLVVNLAGAGLVVSVLSSVLYILAINECITDHELRRFNQHMGIFAQLPLLSFLFGVIMFGGVTLCFWCYRTFTLWWFISYGVLAYMSSGVVLFPAASWLVISLYGAKQSRNGYAHLSMQAMRDAVRLAITDLYGGDAELCIKNDVKEWILGKIKCLDFVENTKRKFNSVYEEALRLLLKEEYVRPVDDDDE
ncbi:hypothetical protein EON65_46670 [archaeon]|nr:MAG: hypothetical protein EON65_46670 [archaeon]